MFMKILFFLDLRSDKREMNQYINLIDKFNKTAPFKQQEPG